MSTSLHQADRYCTVTRDSPLGVRGADLSLESPAASQKSWRLQPGSVLGEAAIQPELVAVVSVLPHVLSDFLSLSHDPQLVLH